MPRGVHNGHKRGPEHHRWNHGRIVSAEGYVKVRVGVTHPLADPNGYAYEHALVVVAAIGRPLGPDETVHHCNGDREDNRLENLEVLTRTAHAAIHSETRSRDSRGRYRGAA